MKLFLSLEYDIVISMVQKVIKRIDVYGVITFFPFMYEGFLIVRITADIDIRPIAGIYVVAIAGDVRRGRTRLFKRMEQEIPGIC